MIGERTIFVAYEQMASVQLSLVKAGLCDIAVRLLPREVADPATVAVGIVAAASVEQGYIDGQKFLNQNREDGMATSRNEELMRHLLKQVEGAVKVVRDGHVEKVSFLYVSSGHDVVVEVRKQSE